MGQIKITEKLTVELYTRLFVNQDGVFLGEYAPPQLVEIVRQRMPDDAIELPEDAPPPPSHRHIWDGAEWTDPGPSDKELAAIAAAEEAAAKKAAAIAKLEALGLTEEDIRSML